MSKFKQIASTKSAVLDSVAALLLVVAVFALYTHTLVPAVLDGDQGHFQYISAALGISYPTGFPLYMLLGHLWSLLPIGSLAYRMNLFSAFFGALTVGLLFVALRRQKLHVLAALAGALTLALIPPFWYYAIIASEHTLNMFIVVALFTLLAEWEATRNLKLLWFTALAFGFGLTNHPTFLLLAPATVIFVLFVGGRRLLTQPKTWLSVLFAAVPGVLYLYLPLRGTRLLAKDFVLPDFPKAVAQGMVSPFYKDTPMGLLQFMMGQTFVKNLAASWQWNTLFADLGTIITLTLNWLIVIFIVCGVVWFWMRRVKLAAWMTIVVLTYEFVALQYVYTVLVDANDLAPFFQKFFLPGFVGLMIFAAWGADGILRGVESRVHVKMLSIAPALLMMLALVIAWQDLSARYPVGLVKRSQDVQAKWDTVKEYPPEPGAALVGHWGDLTPLWYFQTAEGWRRDLVTIFPPTDEQADLWIKSGKPLYLAGSLLEWAPGIAKNYTLTPWGPLVRVTAREYVPNSPLARSATWVFGEERPLLHLAGYDFSPEVVHAGESVELAVYWEILNSISMDDYLIYFWLSSPTGDSPKQNSTLTVSWLPQKRLIAGQRILGTYRFAVPAETPPGAYDLRLLVYSLSNSADLDITDGVIQYTSISIGTVKIEP